MFQKLRKHQFLFEELVKRDFKKKYKRTMLGMGWSMLSPLLMLLVMKVVFGYIFGRGIPHYTTYLFCGLLTFNWFSESTNGGMVSLLGNAGIFTKVNVPKYLFLFSRNIQVLINFALTLAVFFLFCALDHVSFSWKFVLLAYPIATLLLLNVGIGMILSALYVFFRDIDYLWRVFIQLLMYGSAVFYDVDMVFGGESPIRPLAHFVFSLNPLFRHIAYFREIVLSGTVPSVETHLALLGFSTAAFLAGALMYKRYNTRFLYYV